MNFEHICCPSHNTLLSLQARGDLSGKLKAAQQEVAALKEQLDEEETGKTELQRNYAKASTEASQYKSKLEGEAKETIQELEESRFI